MKSAAFVLILACICNAQDYQFPDNFLFGVSTASYQVEGAWNVSGKGENVWDRLTHSRPEVIADGSNGDVACDAYHKVAEDVQLLKKLGVDFYRFSISWSRILPTGHVYKVNPDGIRYYNELIDALLAEGIIPLVSMFHWDTPQDLEDIGGWPNTYMADLFVDYADLLFENFGDRVQNWITFNEPYQICEAGYSGAEKAPLLQQSGIGGYLCMHTLLLAHGRTYQLYNEKYRASQQGRVGISVDTLWYDAYSDKEENYAAAELELQMNFGWFTHPIFSATGDYPPIMRERIDTNSEEEGFPRSRLPYFTQDEIEMIRGSADFLGLNHYTTLLCIPLPDQDWSSDRPSQLYDAGGICIFDFSSETSASYWLRVMPLGFRKILNWIKNNYDNPEVIITENGFSDTGELQDCRRINYHNLYLEQLLLAIHEDGCNVTGYTAWSFLDNFEWLQGYTERFGFHYVDFEDDNRPRIPKMSSYIYRNIIDTRRIDWDYTPENFESCAW